MATCICASRENQTKHAGRHSSLTLAINISIIMSASVWGRDINKEAWSSAASSQSAEGKALKLGVQVPAIFYWWHIFSQSVHRGELWCWFLIVTDFYPVVYETRFLVLVCPSPVKMVGVVKAYSCTAPGHQEVPHTGDTPGVFQPHCHIKVKVVATISWNTQSSFYFCNCEDLHRHKVLPTCLHCLNPILTLNPCFWKPIIGPLKL